MPGRHLQNIRSAVAEGGALRAGHQTQNMRTHQNGCWYVTTPDRSAAETMAELYGGTVEPWWKKEGQWVVHTETDEVTVWLPLKLPRQYDQTDMLGALADSVVWGPLWKLWNDKKRRMVRECDGQLNRVRHVDGQVTEEGCLCEPLRPAGYVGTDDGEIDPFGENRWRECSPESRIEYVIPEVTAGTWRTISRAGGAAVRWRGQVKRIAEIAAITSAQRVEARLKLVQAKGVDGVTGQAKQWYDILILPTATPVEILRGENRLTALNPGGHRVPVLNAGDDLNTAPVIVTSPAPTVEVEDQYHPDGDVVDEQEPHPDDVAVEAEIVPDDDDDDRLPTAVEFSDACGEVGQDRHDALRVIRAAIAAGGGEVDQDDRFADIAGRFPREVIAAYRVLLAGSVVTVAQVQRGSQLVSL